MKLATLGLATALVFTGTYALAQSTGGASGRKFGHGWRGNKRHDRRDLPRPARPPATRGRCATGVSNSAGSAAAGQNSRLNPSGNTLINPSPSGSTLAPTGPGSICVGR